MPKQSRKGVIGKFGRMTRTGTGKRGPKGRGVGYRGTSIRTSKKGK